MIYDNPNPNEKRTKTDDRPICAGQSGEYGHHGCVVVVP